VRPSHRHRRLSAAQAKAIVLSIAEAAKGFADSVLTKTAVAVANVSLTVALIKLL
jgi:riboflavin synthase alpha subunit